MNDRLLAQKAQAFNPNYRESAKGRSLQENGDVNRRNGREKSIIIALLNDILPTFTTLQLEDLKTINKRKQHRKDKKYGDEAFHLFGKLSSR